MFKEEIVKLKSIKISELIICFLLFLGLILGLYYLDKSVVSFLVPCFIYWCAKELGINRKDTPNFYFLMIAIIICFVMSAFLVIFFRN